MISQSSSGTKGRAIPHLRSGALGPLHYTARLFLKQFLKDLDFAAGYITEAIEEGEAAFLLAVRDVVEAQGGIGELAKSTSLNCEGLYDMLSEKGNPRLFSPALSQKSGSSSGVPGVTRPFQMRRLSPHAVVG